MKKTKKALASLAIAGMALTMVPFNAFATGTVPTRLAGTTAAQTAAAIADQTGWTGTAILASSASYGMVDALTAGPLASYLKAPILLTGAGNTLDADTKAELTKLNVKKVYVTSGTAVISQAVLDQLSGMGITVVPLGGVDRAATSVNIAKQMGTVTKVAVANGLQDALSIAAVASAAGEPILLTDKDALPASVSAYLAANSGITSSDVIGGTGVISDAVKAALPGATRHAGTTAYDTNNQVIQDFASSLKFDNVYVANGQTGIDALAGAPLAAQTNSAIVLTDGTVPAAASFVHGKLASSSVVTALGGAAVVSDAVRTGVINGSAPQQGNLAVTSVSAISASSIKVVFNQAPADTSKVVFTTANGGTPLTTTTTWNAANTEATLTASYSLPQGTYTVKVKNDTTDLGSSTVTVTQQAVSKITVTSTVLAVDPATQKGYITYKVLDQYNNDITTTTLGNDIQWTPGIGSLVSAKNGTIVIQQNGVPLSSYTSAVINGYDTDNYVTTSATLSVSQSAGTLSAITLNRLTSPNNDDLNAGNASGIWYLDFTATDASGNPTNDYTLINAGIQSVNVGAFLKLASGTTNGVEQDPSNSTKAAIPVQIDTANAANLAADTQIPITILTTSGKTSTLTVTLKKAAVADSFTLSAPTQTVSSGQTVTIPYTAYDQNGVALNKYTDFVNPDGTKKVNLTISGGANGTIDFVRNADGTASVQAVMPQVVSPSGSMTVYLQSSVVSTGKASNLTISVQQPTKADSLAVDGTVAVPFLQAGASETLDFGYNKGGLALNDQYGRAIDVTNQATTAPYYVALATTTNDDVALTGSIYDVTTVTNSATGVTTVTPTVLGSGVLHKGSYYLAAAPTAAQIANLTLTTDVPVAGLNTPFVAPVTVLGVTTTHSYGVAVNNNTGVTINALTNGTVNVNYETYKVDPTAVPTTTIADTGIGKSVSYVVVKDSDITDYSIDAVANPIKMFNLNPVVAGGLGPNYLDSAANADINGTAASDGRDSEYYANPEVWGKTAGGAKVVLAGRAIAAASIDSGNFVLEDQTLATANDTDATQTTDAHYNNFKVYAKTLSNPTSTSSSTNLTVTVIDATGNYHNLTTAIKSTTDGSVVSGIGFSASNKTGTAGFSVTGNTVTVDTLAHFVGLDSKILTRYANDGSTTNRAGVYFYAKDQFGTKAAPITLVSVTDFKFGNSTLANPVGTATAQVGVDLNGNFILQLGANAQANATHGDYVVLSAVTANGKIQTIKVTLK